MKVLRLVLLSSAFLLTALSMIGQKDYGYPKNYVMIGFVGGSVYTQYPTYYGYSYLGTDFNALQIGYSRRLTKNIFTSVSTYKISDNNRRFTAGAKINGLASFRLQPGFLIDFATATSDYEGELQFGGSLDYHLGDYFVLGSTFRAGLADGLVYGFSGTVKF